MKSFLFFVSFSLFAIPVQAATGEAVASSHFSNLNWIILIVFLMGTTVIGELVKRKDEGLDSFFKGGKEIPWWAVTLSLIATKTSVSTFIAVPAFVFSLNGNLPSLREGIEGMDRFKQLSSDFVATTVAMTHSLGEEMPGKKTTDSSSGMSARNRSFFETG